jgi:hypothetical protein
MELNVAAEQAVAAVCVGKQGCCEARQLLWETGLCVAYLCFNAELQRVQQELSLSGSGMLESGSSCIGVKPFSLGRDGLVVDALIYHRCLLGVLSDRRSTADVGLHSRPWPAAACWFVLLDF